MKIFLDSADVSKIKILNETGLIDGITTNPSLISKQGRKIQDVISEICNIVTGPVSAEVISEKYEDMLKEADELAEIAPNVCIKLPITYDGLRACNTLSSKDIMVNMTLCFSPAQGLMAAKAGASFVSPFIGRLDDIGVNGMFLISELRSIFDNYGYSTGILAASIRNPIHFIESAKVGADAATIPPELFNQLIAHPLTSKGIETFLTDHKKAILAVRS
jgi:transaldolase